MYSWAQKVASICFEMILLGAFLYHKAYIIINAHYVVYIFGFFDYFFMIKSEMLGQFQQGTQTSLPLSHDTDWGIQVSSSQFLIAELLSQWE